MKSILVTGGNRGIGKEICRQLAAAGHEVYLGSRDQGKGEAAAQGMEGSVTVLSLDLNDPAQMTEAVKSISRLDVLINNAAIMTGSVGADTVDLEEVRRVFETNFWGAWRLSQLVLPLLYQSSDARIVNLSSGMGALDDLKGGRYAPYRMSKAGINALTLQLSGDLRGRVIVNSMCPGWVQTDMGGAGATRPVEKGAETAVWLATAPNIPTGRFWRDRREIPW